jgi:hypothetical protein
MPIQVTRVQVSKSACIKNLFINRETHRTKYLQMPRVPSLAVDQRVE